MTYLIGSGGNSVLVVTHNQCFQQGSMISGNAYVNVVNPTSFSGVFLKVSGKEHVRWVEETTEHRRVIDRRGGGARTISTTVRLPVTHVGRHSIFKAETIIMQGGSLLQGQYTIPFSFQLPMGVPGSFSLSGFHRGQPFYCAIEYTVKVIVRIPGILKSNLRHITPITVIQPPPEFSTSISASNSSHVMQFCCVPRGRVDLSFKCAKDTFCPGEPVEVVASADNRSKSSLKRITIKLRRSIELRSNSGRIFVLHETVAQQIGPRVMAHSMVDNIVMSLQVPINAPQQCFGSIVRCLYSVALTGTVRWGRDARCSVPAFIYQAFVGQGTATPQVTASWTPVVLEAVNMSLSTPVSIPAPLKIEAYPDHDSMYPSAPFDDA